MWSGMTGILMVTIFTEYIHSDKPTATEVLCMSPNSKAQPHKGVERSRKILLGRQGRMENGSPRTSGL